MSSINSTKHKQFQPTKGIKNTLWIATGIAATTPVVEIPFFGRHIPLVNCLLALSTIATFRDYRVKDARFGLFFVWLAMLLLSGMAGMLYFANLTKWVSATVSALFKTILLLGIYTVIACSSDEQGHPSVIKDLIQGLLIGCYLNCIWCMLDAADYYLFGESLTNRLFASYISRHSIRYGQLSLIRDGIIRSGALTGDPANGGFYASLLSVYAILSRKGRVGDYLIGIGALIASVSVSGIASVLIGSIIALVLRKGQKPQISIIAIIIPIFLLAIPLIPQAANIIEPLSSRVAQKLSQGDSLRVEYYSSAIPILLSRNPLQALFGTGVGTTSFDFLNSNPYIYLHEEYRPYDPESVYITYLFGCGIIGTLVFCKVLLSGVNRHRIYLSDTSQIVASALLAGGIIGFFYHYTLYLPMMLFMICSDQMQLRSLRADSIEKDDGLL